MRKSLNPLFPVLFCILLPALSLAGCQLALSLAKGDDQDVPDMADGRARVSFLGLDKGEATLIQIENINILVDTGAPSAWKQLKSELEKKGVKRIDYLFLTNGEALFAGNLESLLQQYDVTSLYVSRMTEKEVLPGPVRGSAMVKRVEKGDLIRVGDDAAMEILHPGEELSLSPQNNSLVLRFIHGKISFLLTSAIHAEAEQELVNEYDLQSQILKVSAGGSIFATSEAFLDEVDAHAAVIFNYGDEVDHGKNEVIKRLEESWIEVYLVEKQGTITVESTGTDYQIKKQK